jgi:hypothetical protein
VAGFDVEPVFKGLSQTWGLLLARGPGVAEGVVEAPFGLSDLALSVVDYLGLADRGAHFFGRSVFRDYATPRHLFFGNVNLGSLGAFEPQGTLLVCSGGVRCRRHPVPDARWFGALPGSEPAGDDDAGVRLLQDVARRSAPSGAHRPDAYALLLDPVVELEDSRAHMLHGGQYVHLAADEWIEVRYAVSVEGDPGASVEWVHRLAGFRNEKLFARRERLEAGQRLELVYRYVPEGEKGQIQCRTTARRVSGDRARLLHGEARMLIRRGERPPVGTQLLRFDVASD